jgi:hypothetical protein
MLSIKPTEICSFIVAINCSNKSYLAVEKDTGNFDDTLNIGSSALAWKHRTSPATNKLQNQQQSGVLILGEGQDYRAHEAFPYMGCAGSIRCDARTDSISICSAITGLPPIFIYSSKKVKLIASSIEMISNYPGVELHFDTKALCELATAGFPLDHRTLFREISLLPPGQSIVVNESGYLSNGDPWEPLLTSNPIEPDDHLNQLAELLRQAITRMDVSHSFLSLTAGLDTRAIFAVLQQLNRDIPAYTITGARQSIDALRARKLCESYDLPFSPISLNSNYIKQLPELAETASRLSGGLVSISETPDVYMYQNVASGISARVCGNIGNQLGRGSTEGMSLRNASLNLLNDAVSRSNASKPDEHWMLSRAERSGFGLRFLIQQENFFSTLGGNSIASAFATQQMPYADRSLIESSLTKPLPHNEKSQSVLAIRLRDLRHRFLGPSRDLSFQIRCIAASGGPLAKIPINWGWKPEGGISFPASLLGGLALLDALFGSKAGFAPTLQRLKIRGLSEFRSEDPFFESYCSDFSRDLLSSKSTRSIGIFNDLELGNLIDKGFAEQSHYRDLLFATDVALAAKTFRATL